MTDPVCDPILDCEATLRSVALHLREFCDESLPYTNMVRHAAVQAAAEISSLRAEVERLREAEHRRGTAVRISVEYTERIAAANTKGDVERLNDEWRRALDALLSPTNRGATND